jgi:3'-phosphoadenosine 5'-phosphosulfate sulfotransferase (PAPS reductase)/FAD synthetase
MCTKKKKKRRIESVLFNVGDMSCTAAVDSAATISEVVGEIRSSTISERGARIDDKRSGSSNGKRTTRIF